MSSLPPALLCKNRVVRYLGAGLLSLLVVASLLPLRFKVLLHTEGTWHDTFHVILFSGISLVLLATARENRKRFFRLALLVFAGLLIEFLEDFLYHSGMEWHDVLVNTVAAVAAWPFFLTWQRLTSAPGSA